MESLDKIATKEFASYKDMYKVIDFINKNLKEYKLILGLREKDGKEIISIYKEKE